MDKKVWTTVHHMSFEAVWVDFRGEPTPPVLPDVTRVNRDEHHLLSSALAEAL